MLTINEQVVDAGFQVEDEIEALKQEIKQMESILPGLQAKASKARRSGKLAILAGSYQLQTNLGVELKQTKGLLKMRRDELNNLIQMFEEVGGLEPTTKEPAKATTTGADKVQVMTVEATIKPMALWSAEPSVFSPSSSAKPWGP